MLEILHVLLAATILSAPIRTAPPSKDEKTIHWKLGKIFIFQVWLSGTYRYKIRLHRTCNLIFDMCRRKVYSIQSMISNVRVIQNNFSTIYQNRRSMLMIDWLIELCFTPLSTVFQSDHGDSSHYSCLSRVSPVLGWDSEVSCPRTLPRKTSEDPARLKPRIPGLIIKYFTTEPRRTPKSMLKTLPNDSFSDLTKFKAFADDK